MSARCLMAQGTTSDAGRSTLAAALLRRMGIAAPRPHEQALLRERSLDRLADAVETHLDMARVLALLA